MRFANYEEKKNRDWKGTYADNKTNSKALKSNKRLWKVKGDKEKQKPLQTC